MTAEIRGRLRRKARVIAPGPVVSTEGAWSFFGAVSSWLSRRYFLRLRLFGRFGQLMKSIFAAISNPPSYPVRPIRRFSRPDHSLLSLVYDLLHQGDHFRRLNHDFFGQGLQIVSMNQLGIKSFLLSFPNEIRV